MTVDAAAGPSPAGTAVLCPFCGSGRTSVLSAFGGNAGESLLHCGDCRSAFHWVKWEGRLPPLPGAVPTTPAAT